MAKSDPQSFFSRLTKLFRTGPVVKRKLKSIDTTVAAPDENKSSGALFFQKSQSPTYSAITANAYNLSERLMRYQDFVEMEYSISQHTQIATPDGFIEIGELAQRCLDDPEYRFIVYSYDHERGHIVPAYGKQARQTCTDHAWKITFDSGKSITASPEHRLMLRDGSYKKVEDLQVGDSMMPFYRRDLFEKSRKCASNGTKSGYHWIYTMNKEESGSFNGWVREHTLIAEWIAGRRVTEDEVVHHINFKKTDNRPENLRIMTVHDHNSYHSNINNKVKWNEENHQWIEEFKKNHAGWMRDNAPTRRRDITFSKILQTCEKVGFKLENVASTLDIDYNLIKERLVANGFKNFADFEAAYASGEHVEQVVQGAAKLTRELSLDEIKRVITEDDTKSSAAIKLGCTVNVLDKFLDRRININWGQLRESLGFKGTKSAPRAGGRPKSANGHPLTFQQICDAYSKDMTLPTLSKKLNVNKNTIISRLAQNGFKKYSEFAQGYENHKIVSIEYVGVLPLFDLTVDGYKNFATDSIISHNTPEIASALDIYADETCSADERGRSLHIYSENPKVKEILEDLFFNNLNIEFNLRPWIRNLVKYGDMFLYNDVSPEHGVINVVPIPVNEIEREENFDADDPFAVRFRWTASGMRVLENWEVTHFRLLGNDMFLPYGSSVIEPARRIWRQLILMEDAMLVYRVVRAPERRVFSIDVGAIPTDEVPLYMEEQKKQLRSSNVVDRNTGRVDLRHNALSIEEDYFLAVRGGESGTKIETLAGGQNAAAVEDVQYIQKKLFSALKVPKAYLGYDEMLSSKSTLAQEDIRFSRTINSIQKVIISELNKVAMIHLFALGYEDEEIMNFVLRLSNPSTIAQQQKLELWKSKFEISGQMPEKMGSKEFVRREIWGLSKEEIEELDEQRLDEQLIDKAIEAAVPDGEEGGGEGGDAGGGGLDDIFGGGGEEEPAQEPSTGEDEEPETAGEEPEEETDNVELLLAGDDEDEKLKALDDEDHKNPVRRSKHSKTTKKKRDRKVIQKHMPDFGRMIRTSADSDPYDSKFTIKPDTLIEDHKRKAATIPHHMSSIFNKMSSTDKFMNAKRNNKTNFILKESVDIQDEIDNELEIDFDF